MRESIDSRDRVDDPRICPRALFISASVTDVIDSSPSRINRATSATACGAHPAAMPTAPASEYITGNASTE